MSFKHINEDKELSGIRREAASKALRVRWGEPRGKSKQIRVDVEAASALETLPESERRKIASSAIIEAVKRFKR